MNDSNDDHDDERLSALIEGRLQGPPRTELLAHLAAADDDYRVFADTAAVLQALEDEDASAGEPGEADAIPFRRPGRARAVMPRRALMAAAAAGIVLVSALTLRDRAASGPQPVRLAARVDPAGQGLPDDWLGRSRWSSARGGGPAGAGDAEAVRAGALLADLAVAVQARDADDTRVLAEQVRGRWGRNVGGSAPLREISARAGAPPESLNALLDQAADRLARLGPDALELGAWTEAALLAAHARNEDFFQDGAHRAMLRRAERLIGGDGAARAALARVRAAIPEEGALRWDTLEQDLDTLLRAMAG